MNTGMEALHQNPIDEPAYRNIIPNHKLRIALTVGTVDCLNGKVVDLAAIGAQVDEVISDVASGFLENPGANGNPENLCKHALVAVSARLRSLGGYPENDGLYTVANSVRDLSQIEADELLTMTKTAEGKKEYAEELHCRLELVLRGNIPAGEYAYDLLRIGFCADRVGDLRFALDYYDMAVEFLQRPENQNLSEQSLIFQCKHQIFRLRGLLGIIENPEEESTERLNLYVAALKNPDTKPMDRLLALKGSVLVHRECGNLIEAVKYALKYLDEESTHDSGGAHTVRAIEKLKSVQRELATKGSFSIEDIADFPPDSLIFLAVVAESNRKFDNAIAARRALLQREELDFKNRCISFERLRKIFEDIGDDEKAFAVAEEFQEFLERESPDESNLFRARHDLFRLKEKIGRATPRDEADRQELYEDLIGSGNGDVIDVIIALDYLAFIVERQGRAEDALDYLIRLINFESRAGRDSIRTKERIQKIRIFLRGASEVDIVDVVANVNNLSLKELKFWVRVSHTFPAERILLAEALLAREDCDADGTIRGRLALSYLYEESGYFEGALNQMRILIDFQKAHGLDVILSRRRVSSLWERAKIR